MFLFAKRRYDDPISEAWRRIFRRLRNWLVVLLLLLLGACLRGVPHLLGEYEYVGHYPGRKGIPTTAKVSGTYIGPFGFREVRAGQYGQRGCPVLLFIPLQDCFE